MSSVILTESEKTVQDAGMRPWHFYLLLAMAAATFAVIEAQNTHPAALLLLSAAILASGLAGAALHNALLGFFGGSAEERSELDNRTRQALEQEKALVLRSIKELEFDRAMRKVSDADFEEIGSRLRARAMSLMEQLDAAPPSVGPVGVPHRAQVEVEAFSARDEAHTCAACAAPNDADARFCKACGARLS